MSITNNVNQKELWKQIQTSQNKYTYFLMAIAASAIAFAFKQVDDRVMEYVLIPLGISIILWALSFYFGCEIIKLVHGEMFFKFHSNFKKTDDYKKTMVKMNEEESQETEFKLVEHINKLQLRFFIFGTIFYLVWQFIEMLVRTLTIS